ncbi:MAG: 4Fe-4S dicluster domain-containing protein [Ruminococcaceae bacterium]|nr:4Fe-4S dicluster domain-containing protein [Oscillospiraceae bacterium]
MPYSIRAGVRIEQLKNTKGMKIETIPEPQKLIFDIDTALVKEGEKIKKWQKIGEKDGIGVFSGVSGSVTGLTDESITVENDFMSLCENVMPVQTPIKELESGQIAEILRNTGVMNGGEPAVNGIGKVNRLIVNLMETEPYLCASHRLALENTAEILGGAKILMKACGVRHAVIAVEYTKRDAIRALRDALGLKKLFEIKAFEPKYPQDDPRQLIYALYGKELSGDKSLLQQGYGVFDTMCCVDTYRALVYGISAVSRYITVDGDCIAKPKNLCVPVGTPLSHIIGYCGGFVKEPHKILDGSVMRGKAVYSTDYSVKRDTNGFIVLSQSFEKKRETDCINCGRCVKHCPMYLMPYRIVKGEMKGASSCTSCGICSYVCPANISLTQKISSLREAENSSKA